MVTALSRRSQSRGKVPGAAKTENLELNKLVSPVFFFFGVRSVGNSSIPESQSVTDTSDVHFMLYGGGRQIWRPTASEEMRERMTPATSACHAKQGARTVTTQAGLTCPGFKPNSG